MSEVQKRQPPNTAELQFTDAAREHLVRSIKKQANAVGVRFSVKKAGCSGLSYVIEYVDAEGENDISFTLSEHYHVFVDKDSLVFIQNTLVDYVKEGFCAKLVFSNPNQKGQCGCGESFMI